MMNWTRRHTLIVGLALILLTNAVALLGVYWNRSGNPESMLKLSERELQQPYGWGMNRENSGIALRINWRVLSADMNWNYPYSGGNPEWLDQAKMASLGFDVGPAADVQDDYRRNNRQLSKEAYLVLEMDGPAYQQSLQRARQNAAEQDAKLAALPDDKGSRTGAKRAHEGVNTEEQKNSRLFAVDAGLSQAQLRAKYPDRNRHAIVRARSTAMVKQVERPAHGLHRYVHQRRADQRARRVSCRVRRKDSPGLWRRIRRTEIRSPAWLSGNAWSHGWLRSAPGEKGFRGVAPRNLTPWRSRFRNPFQNLALTPRCPPPRPRPWRCGRPSQPGWPPGARRPGWRRPCHPAGRA